jgi:3-deoxy-D-manno-octulosonic-acid transferase
LPQLQLILAPRHPHRVVELEALARPFGFSSERLSHCIDAPLKVPVDIVMVDQMGVLLPLYDLADVAFIGGSLIEFGGQNPIEAALVSTPTVSGPHCFNFTEIVEKLVGAGAMYQVITVEELVATTSQLLCDRGLRERSGAAGFAEAEANRGVSRRVAQQLVELIGNAAH